MSFRRKTTKETTILVSIGSTVVNVVSPVVSAGLLSRGPEVGPSTNQLSDPHAE